MAIISSILKTLLSQTKHLEGALGMVIGAAGAVWVSSFDTLFSLIVTRPLSLLFLSIAARAADILSYDLGNKFNKQTVCSIVPKSPKDSIREKGETRFLLLTVERNVQQFRFWKSFTNLA